MDRTVFCAQCNRPLRRIPQGWLDDEDHFVCERGPGINHRPRERMSQEPSPRHP